MSNREHFLFIGGSRDGQRILLPVDDPPLHVELPQHRPPAPIASKNIRSSVVFNMEHYRREQMAVGDNPDVVMFYVHSELQLELALIYLVRHYHPVKK